MKHFFLALYLCLTPSLLLGEESPDDPLLHLIKNSDIVVSVALVEDASCDEEETGALQCGLECKVIKTLHGHLADTEKIIVSLTVSAPQLGDKLRPFSKDSRWILFLKKDSTIKRWKGTDLWLSVQPYNRYLASHIEELSRDLSRAK